jgi:hypothetical protein
VSPPDRLRARFRDPEKTRFARADEFAHRADRFLDRHRRIDPVNVIEIDDFGLQPSQAALARRLDVFRAAVGGWRSVRPPQIAELAGDDVIVPALADRPADQLLVAAIAIGVRCIEEVDAEFTGAADRVDRRCRIGLAIKWRHCRAAEAERRDLQRTELSPLHSNYCPRLWPPYRAGSIVPNYLSTSAGNDNLATAH